MVSAVLSLALSLLCSRNILSAAFTDNLVTLWVIITFECHPITK